MRPLTRILFALAAAVASAALSGAAMPFAAGLPQAPAAASLLNRR
jgi:hypothetical protein